MYLQYIFYILFSKNWKLVDFGNYVQFSILRFELRLEPSFLPEE